MLISLMLCVEQLTAAFVSILEEEHNHTNRSAGISPILPLPLCLERS